MSRYKIMFQLLFPFFTIVMLLFSYKNSILFLPKMLFIIGYRVVDHCHVWPISLSNDESRSLVCYHGGSGLSLTVGSFLLKTWSKTIQVSELQKKMINWFTQRHFNLSTAKFGKTWRRSGRSVTFTIGQVTASSLAYMYYVRVFICICISPLGISPLQKFVSLKGEKSSF